VGNLLAQKPVKAGEGAFGFVLGKSWLWAKAVVAFGPFCWLLTFAKVKVGWKVQPKAP
jgi:hypothetical protein